MDEKFKSQNHIDELRRRLYARNASDLTPERHGLHDAAYDVATDWEASQEPAATPEPTSIPVQPEPESLVISAAPKPRRYRRFIILGSLFVFLLAAALSSAYLFFGGNQISSNNIDLVIAGPNTVGGGEKISLQVALTNQNSVALESATVIIKYPPGARTAEEPVEDLFEQRIWLDTIAAGEAKNIPIQATIFGEEGDSKEISATLEYRIAGSNGTFYKDAEPLSFQVVTSPIVLQVKSIKKVASGQEVEVDIEVRSNTPTPFKDLLISATYPNGFTYKAAEPEPAYSQNVWRIPELNSGETKTIKVRGTVKGLTDETMRLSVSAGPAQPDNQFIVGTTITESYTEFTIERPFLDVKVQVNGKSGSEVVLLPSETASVMIFVNNTLDESVYDMKVEVVPSGNAFRDDLVTPQSGYYDSNTGVISWQVANVQDFSRVNPGDMRQVTFSVMSGDTQRTAAFDLTVNVYGRRVAEPNAQEQLVGTVSVKAKYASDIKLESSTNVVSGPVPPKVGETTTYAIALLAQAGVNDVTNAVVKTTLPVHVNWLNDYATDGSVTYNNVSHELTWQVGNIDSGKQKELIFTVSILPSSSQVGIKPVLINRQIIEGTDRFTATGLEAESRPITTDLGRDAGYGEKSGEVVAN